jgi:hypothetical protein
MAMFKPVSFCVNPQQLQVSIPIDLVGGVETQ